MLRIGWGCIAKCRAARMLCWRPVERVKDIARIKSPTATSLGEVIKLICKRSLGENKVLWFRGHHSASWSVLPSLWRQYGPDDERNFTNRFRARASSRHQSLPNYDNSAIWLSLMQQYGLPTRLLDWTRSPLIGLYFALEAYIYKEPSRIEDAVLWILDPHVLNELEGFGRFTPSIDAHICEPMLRPAFTDREAPESGKVLAAMSSEKDIRMFVQQGCFTIHSDQTPLDRRACSDKYLSRICIPEKFVRQMAFEIDVCGFRRGDVFPDLGNLAAELKFRHSAIPTDADLA